MTSKEHYRFLLVTMLLIGFFGMLIAVKTQKLPQEASHLPIAADR